MTGRGRGRPHKLDQPLVVRDPFTNEDQHTTVAEYIVELITRGAYGERAARSAGIATATYHSWLAQGGQVRTMLGENPSARLTAAQRRHLDFLEAVDSAEARYETTGLLALERIGLGQVTLETITERWMPGPVDPASGERGPDVLVERTVKRHGVPPNAAALQWKLTRKFPDRYQLREDMGTDTPVPDLTKNGVDQLVGEVEAFLAQQSPG